MQIQPISVKSKVLKSTGKSVGFFNLHDKLTNIEGKMSGTVRAYTLDQRQFNIPECPVHFYKAVFQLNYAQVCNNDHCLFVFCGQQLRSCRDSQLT